MDIDHLVILAETLDEGRRAVADMLGATPEGGGKHALMGTHNAVLSLGPDTYLEVIAVDPDAPPPGRARWFGLDTFSGPPRLGNWVARCGDLRGQLGQAPMGMGDVLELSRGDLAWSMAVPANGRLPGDDVLPALMQWKGPRPQKTLPETGCKLKRIVLRHPEIDRLQAEWPVLGRMAHVALEPWADTSLEAEIVTPRGLVTLSSLVQAG